LTEPNLVGLVVTPLVGVTGVLPVYTGLEKDFL